MNPENNTPAVLTAEEIAKKENAWKTMGNNVVTTKLELEQLKNVALAKIKDVPHDPAKIVEYEAKLAEVKKDKNAVIEKRKVITAKFDKVAANLMVYEKEFDPAIKLFEDGLLFVKQGKAKADKEAQAKVDEVRRVREQIANSITSQYADFESKIVDTVMKYYKQCLGTEERAAVPEAELPAKIANMQVYLKEENFTLIAPTLIVTYMKNEDVKAIWDELVLVNAQSPASFVGKYVNAIVKQFEFYGIAVKNKADSIKLAEETAASALNDIANAKEDNEIAAKLSAISTGEVTDVSVNDGGKAIKSVYKLDMEDSEQNAIQIIAAFSANWHKAKEHLSVKKYFNLNVRQMGDALVSMRNKGELLSITGINFKLIDKL